MSRVLFARTDAPLEQFAPHQQLQRPASAHELAIEQSHHRFGNRHFHAQATRPLHHGAGTVDTFGHMAQRLHRLLPASGLWPTPAPPCRLRDRSPVAVSTRSPKPLKPMKVSALRPGPARAGHFGQPRVIKAARAFKPRPRPSHKPVAMASTFLTAPPTSTPTMSSLA
jgi:hypothetical protein